MSPAAKHRHGPGEKGSEKAKEWKASSRHSSGGGIPANAYNPGSGTFHMLDSSIPETMVVNQSSGRFQSIDDSDDIGSIIGSYSEYDSMSNNGSCSGESEDQSQNIHGKEKKGGHPPGLVGGGSDKREKIRYKNEKKHQRQKERRAQELKDRCTNYLMSRRLEVLAQQLVAMGFPCERATMALILNEGHVERSVAWLLEGGEGEVKENWNAEGNLKLDISEELARIADLEFRFKCLRVEIERAVVACEGDLDKAADWLRDRHPQVPTPLPPPAPAGPATLTAYRNGSQERTREQNYPTPAEAAPLLVGAQGRGNSGLYQALDHQRKGDTELHPSPNRTQGQHSLIRPPGAVEGSFPITKTVPQNASEWQRLSSNINGRYLNNSLRSSMHIPQPAPHSYPTPGRQVTGSRVPPVENVPSFLKDQNFHLTSRDPVVMPQLSQSPITPPPNIRSSSASPSLSPSSWNGNAPCASSPSSVLYFNGPSGDIPSKSGTTSKTSAEIYGKQGEDMVHVLPTQVNRQDMYPAWSHSGSFGSRDVGAQSASLRATASHSRSQSTPGFLSGWGSGLSGAPADWSMWVSSGCDYKTIDWSMGASPSNSSDTRVWGVTSNLVSLLKLSDSGKPRLGLAGESSSQGFTGSREEVSNSMNYNLWNNSNRGNSVSIGLQEKSLKESGSSTGMGVPEWTSPFAGKDLFTLPHHAVPSPSL